MGGLGRGARGAAPTSPPKSGGHDGSRRRALVDAVLASAGRLRPWPWRQTRDPWLVLLSEVVLQQTQAARAVGPWLELTRRFPTPAAAAAAAPAELLRAWRGLGYNRRALALHRAAVVIGERHGGAVPDALEDLMALPGVGPYTARAVLAFAFERDVGVVDTNVRRVLARAVLGHRAPARALQAVADELVPSGAAWTFNQALIDLGATCCTSQRPSCASCPLAGCCRWRAAGCPAPDPGANPTRQSAFAGSDRQGRGRLVEALRHGPLDPAEVAVAAGWPEEPERARRVVAGLVADGLVEVGADGVLRLVGDGG